MLFYPMLFDPKLLEPKLFVPKLFETELLKPLLLLTKLFVPKLFWNVGNEFVPGNWLLFKGLNCPNWLLKLDPPLFIEDIVGKIENPPPLFNPVPKFNPVFNEGRFPPKGLKENCD